MYETLLQHSHNLHKRRFAMHREHMKVASCMGFLLIFKLLWGECEKRVSRNDCILLLLLFLCMYVCECGVTGPLGKCLVCTLLYEEWIHTELEVSASVSVRRGLIFALDVLIWPVLQRHTEACWDHTSALQNNRLHQEPLLSGRQQFCWMCTHTSTDDQYTRQAFLNDSFHRIVMHRRTLGWRKELLQ